MKKIVLVGLVVVLLGGCQMYKTTDVVIENKSNETAIVNVKNFKEGTKQILNQNITIPVSGKIVLPFYDNGTASLESVGRNFLQKKSSTKYEILNSPPVPFKVYNTTSKNAEILDKNNLFDTTMIMANSEQIIQVYNPQNIQPKATNTDGLLEVKIIYSANGMPTNKLRITY